jgi:hypothetical protein
VDIFMPARRKEIDFFNLHFERGVGWYRKFFPTTTSREAYRVIGEISPWYFYTPECPERISQLGIEKLILILRNPTERTWSYYGRAKRDGDFRGTFEEFLAEPSWRAIELGNYARFLEHYRSYFRPEQILILISESAFADVLATKRKVADFLGVSPNGFAAGAGTVPVNASSVPRAPRAYAVAFRAGRFLRGRLDLDWLVNTGKRMGIKRILGGTGKKLPPMSEETRRYLVQAFAPGIAELEGLLQTSLESWR